MGISGAHPFHPQFQPQERAGPYDQGLLTNHIPQFTALNFLGRELDIAKSLVRW